MIALAVTAEAIGFKRWASGQALSHSALPVLAGMAKDFFGAALSQCRRLF